MNGITLIALVVTIVVLLILAGVTIVTLFGQNGIITKAQKAKQETQSGVDNDITGISNLEKDMNEALEGNIPTIKEKGKLVEENIKYAKYTDSTSTEPVYVPGGYCVAKDVENDTNTIANGLVISDLANDTLDNELIDGKRGNQFVWVPVSKEQLSEMYGTDKDGKKWGKLYNFTASGKTNENWTETDGVMSITSITGSREPDIVKEYDGIDATNDSSYFKQAISSTMTGAEFKAQLEKEFNEMIESVQKYKGFYIGRYETTGLSNTDNTVIPTVQKGCTTKWNTSWYNQYKEIKNMANGNNNIASSMIWGCQWDRTLEWIAQANKNTDGKPDYSLLLNSKSWGNYKDSTGEAETNRGILQPSGTNPAWQKNHIYDLAGNSGEMSLSTTGLEGRLTRGGVYYESGSGSIYGYHIYSKPSEIGYIGVFGPRSTLCIK